MYLNLNFTTKSELRQAVAAGLPIILYSPVQGMPAITGRVRAEGPWPGTIPPVEMVKTHNALRGVRNERGALVKPREQLKPWHAEVEVHDMQVVRVVR